MSENKQQTNDYCQESAWYFCKLHQSVRKYIKQGELFPKCEHVTGHSTTWLKDNIQ